LFRYFFEIIALGIHQYFIECSTDGKRFSRNQLTFERVLDFHKNTIDVANELLAVAGKKRFGGIDIDIFMHGDAFAHLPNLYFHANLKNVTQH
jgi:hypothetical protein